MIIIIGFIVVTASVLGGFMMGGGHILALMHPNELVIIGNCDSGSGHNNRFKRSRR